MLAQIQLGVFLICGLSIFAFQEHAQAGLADHVVINEVQIDSITGTGGTDDDWVELYNPTSQAVSLSGWSIQKTSSSGSSLVNQALSGIIPAQGYFLIVRNGVATAQALKDKADLLASDSFSLASNNIIYLVNGTSNIVPGVSNPSIIDMVGFGSAVYYEGSVAAPNITETKSMSRVPDGEDTDQNSIDFVLRDSPTPNNSSSDDDINGTVLLTIVLDENPARNITPTSADILFQVNSNGAAIVNYGLTGAYGSSTAAAAISENVTKTMNLSGLQCGKTYHYSIYAENVAATETAENDDATFTTLPCGIALDSLTMTKTSASANNKYANGWAWEFNITVWNMAETNLKMKFAEWTGPMNLNAGGNMRYSVDNGTTWNEITANGTYSSTGASLVGIDNNAAEGRQIRILLQMKVPVGTKTGSYNSSYGILTE